MKKKILGVILVVFILTAIFPASVYASGITVKEIASGLEYDWVEDFRDGLALALKNGKVGCIDKTGKLVISCVYNEILNFSDGLARVEINGKYNYIDKSGKILSADNYDSAGSFSDGMAWVRIGDKYGYINKSGDIVIPIDYDCYFEDGSSYAIIPDFSEGLAAISINGKCGFIDKTGKLVIPAEYHGNFWRGEWTDYIPMFNDGLARVLKDIENDIYNGYGYGYINKAGEIVVPFEYRGLGHNRTGAFCGGLAKAYPYPNGQAGFIDQNGNIVAPFIYDTVSDFNGTLAYVQNYADNQKGAYIDRTGKVVTPFEYEADGWSMHYYWKSSEGITVAKRDGRMGCLDEKGNIAVPFEFDTITPFSDGLAYVTSGANNHGYVDKTGKFIVKYGDFTYMANSFSSGLAWVEKSGKYGYIDTTGELVVPCVYDEVKDFKESLAVARKGDKWAILEIENGVSPQTGDLAGIILLLGICSIINLTGFKKTKKKRKFL